MSPIFTLRDEGTSIESKSINELHLFSFSENNGSVSALFYPTECVASVPVFEKKGQREEALMGAAGIRKTPVGKLVMKGKCKFGCATVQLVEMWIEKINDMGTDGRSEGPEKVWEWRL
ncbi:hypothetical protein HK098_003022 [Nowakowskiella sp. JEL0407]|nr:hypothetical protein HK098_003022 [Nowakowskiella sp. JEL0407]